MKITVAQTMHDNGLSLLFSIDKEFMCIYGERADPLRPPYQTYELSENTIRELIEWFEYHSKSFKESNK